MIFLPSCSILHYEQSANFTLLAISKVEKQLLAQYLCIRIFNNNIKKNFLKIV